MSNVSLQKARDFIISQNGEIAPLSFSEEELNPDVQDDQSNQAYALESTAQCYGVPYSFPQDSTCSKFNFFEDGRQRTVQVGFIPVQYGATQVLIPVHFFVVAAVVMRRDNKRLSVWDAPLIRQGVLVEKSLVPDQSILEDFQRQGLEVIDTEATGGDYYGLRRKALQKAKSLRLAAEDSLIEKWRLQTSKADDFLVVDGTLMNLRNEKNVERCLGVSKSFGSRYFPIGEHNRILRMNEFERSWTFRFHSPDDPNDSANMGGRERISWYLRLRTRPNTDPEFGLIRVEISQKHAGNARALADEFSKYLLSERLPTSYPAPRWDKHLYPIRACENYLSSVMPSMSTITAFMKG